MNRWKHQDREIENHWCDEARALLWDMRTGKSRTMVETGCILYETCNIDAVVIVAPNGVHREWTLTQLPKFHWSHVPYASFSWTFKDPDNIDRFKFFMTQSGLHWFAINSESFIRDEVTEALKAFLRSWRNFLLIVDESHHFAQPGSQRTFKIRSLARHAAYRRILTGTLMEDAPLQTYSQFQILEDGALGHTNYEDFKKEFAIFELARGLRQYPVVKEYINLDRLRNRMAKYSSVVLRSQCDDLPPVQEITRVVELSPKTKELHRAFRKKDLRTIMAHGFQDVPTGAALLTKLQQSEGGHMITPAGVVDLDDNGKYRVVFEEIEKCTFLILCVYVHEIEFLHKRFDGLYATDVIHGHIGVEQRLRSLDALRNGRIKGIIAQCQTVAEGFEISAADKIIWYSQTHTARVRVQANARTSAMGKASKQVVNLIAPGGVDEYYLKLTNDKTELADDIARHGLQAVIERLTL